MFSLLVAGVAVYARLVVVWPCGRATGRGVVHDKGMAGE